MFNANQRSNDKEKWFLVSKSIQAEGGHWFQNGESTDWSGVDDERWGRLWGDVKSEEMNMRPREYVEFGQGMMWSKYPGQKAGSWV